MQTTGAFFPKRLRQLDRRDFDICCPVGAVLFKREDIEGACRLLLKHFGLLGLPMDVFDGLEENNRGLRSKAFRDSGFI